MKKTGDISCKELRDWGMSQNMGDTPLNEIFPIWADSKEYVMSDWWYSMDEKKFRFILK